MGVPSSRGCARVDDDTWIPVFPAQQEFDERRLAGAVLPQQQHRRLRLEVRLRHQRAEEVAEFVCLLQRPNLHVQGIVYMPPILYEHPDITMSEQTRSSLLTLEKYTCFIPSMMPVIFFGGTDIVFLRVKKLVDSCACTGSPLLSMAVLIPTRHAHHRFAWW